MMDWLTSLLVRNAELAVFLAIGLGYWIGQFKIKGVGLGPVTGSLICGLVIGSLFHVPVSDTAKQLLFLLFMYGIGYSAGPGFIRGLRDGGWRWAAIGILVPVSGLLTATVVARWLNLEMGYAAGMMSGALTESPVIGTASEAIRSLPLSDDEKTRLIQQIPVADALTYVFGTFGVILFCSYVGPWILRLDLKAEAQALERDMGIERHEAGVSSAWHMFELRAYRLEAGLSVVGQTVEQAEAAVLPERMFIERLRRDGEMLDAGPQTVLKAGDVVGVIGSSASLLAVVGTRAEEVFDRELLDIPSATGDVELTNRNLANLSLADLRKQEALFRGVFLKSVRRNGQALPVAPGTVLRRGDLLTLYGLEPAVRRVAEIVGTAVKPSANADFITLGLAIFFGGLAGVSLSLPVGQLHIALGSSVAVLLVGLSLGWRNSTRPLSAYLPPAAVEFMKSIGLAAFVAMIGLKAGPVFLAAVKEIGLAVFLGGIVVTLVPQVVGLVVGRYVLKLNPLLLLGALAGAQTMTAGLAAVQERSDSPVAVIGYSSTVAFGHILISMGGTALIWLLQ